MIDEWMKEYERLFRMYVKENPHLYKWPETEIPIILARMRAAFLAGGFDKESRTIRSCCRVVGIKHTYTAINDFIAGRKS